MPTSANTTSVVEAIQSIVQGITITPVNGISHYQSVNIGALKDLTDQVPAMEITGFLDETERLSMAGVGNTIEVGDYQEFMLTSIFDYTDSTQAWLLCFALRDGMTQPFQSSAKLNNTPGVSGVWLNSGGQGKYGYVKQNGIQYLMHQIRLKVLYEYTTTMVV